LKFAKGQLGLLLFGFIFWLPAALFVFVLVLVLGAVDSWGRFFLSLLLPGRSIHAGLGALLGLVLIYLTGVLLKKTPIGGPLSRLPIIGFLFSQGKGGAMSLKRLFNLTPCLFLFSPSCPSYGWILSEERVGLNGKDAPYTLVNVYYPNVPTIVTGQIFPVRKETVVRLGNPSREIVDLLLYSLKSPERIKLLPWQGETEQEFEKRAVRFGLMKTID